MATAGRGGLPEDDRRRLVRLLESSMSYRKIAKVVGISTSTVYRHKHGRGEQRKGEAGG